MEKFLLRALFIFQKLNIVNQKDVHFAVFIAEFGHVAIFDAFDKVNQDVYKRQRGYRCLIILG